MSNICKYTGFKSTDYIYAYDTTTQNITAVGEAFIWKFNTVDFSSGITIVEDTKITVSKAGVYNIQFSAQVVESNASATDLWVWPIKNGTPIPNSNTKYTLKGSGEAAVIILNFLLRLEKDDYIQIAWTNSMTSSLTYSPSSTNPIKPAIPSIILTAWEI